MVIGPAFDMQRRSRLRWYGKFQQKGHEKSFSVKLNLKTKDYG